MSFRTEMLYDKAKTNSSADIAKLVEAEYTRLLVAEVESLSDQLAKRPTNFITVESVAKALVEAHPHHKIMNIKCLRSIFGIGLKEAKDQIDWAESPWLKPKTNDIQF